jgi:4-hydroxybenzoate polyprenyltransferase
MVHLPTEIIKATRPVHWVKNFALFAALIFSGSLFDEGLFLRVVLAFFSFSLAASATYIFNDLLDVKSDRLHPIKKRRPIAAGKLPITTAYFLSLILALISLYWSSLFGIMFFLLTSSYLAIQVLYSLFLKTLPVIDILVIATGFVIRVYAGAFVIDAHLSVWFLLCVISVALFLASGKRRAELNILEEVGVTRKSLTKYSRELLNSYVTMFGNAAWLSWALFTFFESPRASKDVWLFLAELSRTTTIDKLLMTTIPIVIFGIMRYESLIFEGKSEAPEKLFLTDKALMASIAMWLVLVVWLLYGGVSVQ